MTEIIEATVKFPTGDKIFSGNYGDYQSLVLSPLNGGEDLKIFCKPRQEPHVLLKKGELVKVLIRNENGKIRKELIADSKHVNGYENRSSLPTPISSQSRPNPKPKATRDEISEYIGSIARLYAHCFSQAAIALRNGEVPDGIVIQTTTEDIRTVATTLFITAVKKFHLDSD